jgi:hypothetical protein
VFTGGLERRLIGGTVSACSFILAFFPIDRARGDAMLKSEKERLAKVVNWLLDDSAGSGDDPDREYRLAGETHEEPGSVTEEEVFDMPTEAQAVIWREAVASTRKSLFGDKKMTPKMKLIAHGVATASKSKIRLSDYFDIGVDQEASDEAKEDVRRMFSSG